MAAPQRAHVALQARLAACLAGRIVPDPRTVPYYRRILGLDGGPWRETANYQAMLVASWAWRVHLLEAADRNGLQAKLAEHLLAMGQAERLYELEREHGMFRGECLCPDPHAGMHLEAHVGAPPLAIEAGPASSAPWRSTGSAAPSASTTRLASPDGEPFAPGLRTTTALPRNQAAAALLRMVLGLPHRRPNGCLAGAEELAAAGTTRGPDDYGALRWLASIRLAAGDLRARLRELATSGPFPKLLLPLRVVRFDGGLLASLDRAGPAAPQRLARSRRLGPRPLGRARRARGAGRPRLANPPPDVEGEVQTIGEG